jgi:hypothetical protein
LLLLPFPVGVLDIEMHANTKPRQMGDKVKNMPFDTAKPVERIDHTGQHC